MPGQLVEVRFKGNRKAFYRWHEPEPLALEEPVIVETDRGLDLGRVSATGQVAGIKCERCAMRASASGRGAASARGAETVQSAPAGGNEQRVVRRASRTDTRAADELRAAEDDVRQRVRERVTAHRLEMKVSDAEWQWDRNKLTIYFTAERRVDFRSLVRELASLFRTRIELRQIGVRDESKRLDGIGRCGRQLCCTWLPELRPIGLQTAKDQRLSLNPTQISGACGRLLCCLRYEHDFYVQARKRFPKEGKALATARGTEKVVAIDVFRDRVSLRAADGASRVVGLAELKAEVEAAAAGPGAPPVPAPAPKDAAPPVSRPPAPAPERPPDASGPAAPADAAAPTEADAAPERPARRRGRRGGRRRRHRS